MIAKTVHAVNNMFLACAGKCNKYKVLNRTREGPRYGGNHKRCTNCAKYIEWSGLRCPCCNYKLRTKPIKRNDKIL